MANIANNLKRLLGTTGHNIQEILENTDSLGGDALPTIRFVDVQDPISGETVCTLDESSNIKNPESYCGLCFVTYRNKIGIEYGSMLGYTQIPGSFVCLLIGSNPIAPESMLVHVFARMPASSGTIGYVHTIRNITFNTGPM